VRRPFLHRAVNYDDLWNQIDYRALDIPAEFNLGVACLDDQDPNARALTVVAADDSEVSYTFGAVKDRANRLANVLRDLGIGKGDVVGLVKSASLETAASYMAIFRLGAVALPLSSLFGPDALRYRLRHGEARAVITGVENAAKVREALGDDPVTRIVVGGAPEAGELSFDDALAAANPEFEPVTTAAEDPVFLIYTSGTTGDPKGALHAHRVAFGHIPALEAITEFYPQPGDVFWSPADWAWVGGLMYVLIPAWWYGRPIVVDLDGAFSAERAVWLLRKYAVTLTLLPPTALRMIRASGVSGGDFALRVVLSGSEVVGADLLQWSTEYFGCTIDEAYGQTELNACVGNCASVFPVVPGALGRAMPGTVVAVIDEDGNPLINVEGEIAVDRHHPNTLLEYWRNPKATSDKFVNDWLITGDLGVMDKNGYVWFKSRKDDVIKSSGYRIGPGEIESCLGAHDAVAMAAVIGVADERRGQVPKAFVVVKPGVAPTEDLAEELRQHVRRRLAPHEVPRQVVFIDDLPRTTTGKVMRRALRDP
jgi:acetyl-CoA synthetase